MNDNTLAQITNSADFIKAANKLPYPQSIPYFKIISKKTYETKNSQIKVTPQEYQNQHLARIGSHTEYEILDGTHFIYLNNVSKITKITDVFLSKVNQ